MPKPPEVPFELGTVDHSIDPACDAKFELCAEPEPAGRLVDWVAAAKRYMAAVELRCQQRKVTE